MINTHYQRELYNNKLTNISLQYNDIIELVKNSIKKYITINIEIEDKHESKSLKELLVKENIGAFFYNVNNKEIELINHKFANNSNSNPIMNMVAVCTSVIQAGRSINDNALQIFIQTLLSRSIYWTKSVFF